MHRMGSENDALSGSTPEKRAVAGSTSLGSQSPIVAAALLFAHGHTLEDANDDHDD